MIRDMIRIKNSDERNESLASLYDETSIYCNRTSQKFTNDPEIDIWVCVIFSKKYKLDLVIYTEVSEGQWAVIVCFKKGGYKIYNCGRKVRFVSFQQYPYQLLDYKVPCNDLSNTKPDNTKDSIGKDEDKKHTNHFNTEFNSYYELPGHYQIVNSIYNYSKNE